MRSKLNIIWSIESAKRTDQVIQYLMDDWSEKEVDNFLEALKGFEDMVVHFPEMYPEAPSKKGFRKAVILKQISVLYSIENKSILIHALFDNRQDPDKL